MIWISFCLRRPGRSQVTTALSLSSSHPATLSSVRRESPGGGTVWLLFSNSFSCRLLPTKSYSSFELQLFLVQFTCPVLCVVIYCPPKQNKEFITEFSYLLADLMPKHDCLLICGFLILMFMSANQLAIEFQSLLSSFGQVQSVNVATHQHSDSCPIYHFCQKF